MKDKFEVHRINPKWFKEAEESAIKRRDFHAKKGSRRHWKDPKKGEYDDEIWGSLAHLAFKEQMKQLGLLKDCELAPLFTEDMKTLPDWDFKLFGRTGDIKAIPPDDEKTKRVRMLVKKSEFKKLDYYVAIKFWDRSEYSVCGLATGDEVAAVFPVNFGFAHAYHFFLDKLPHKLEGQWWKI